MYDFTTSLTPMPPRRSQRPVPSQSSAASWPALNPSDDGSVALSLTSNQAYIHPRDSSTGYNLGAFGIDNTIRNLSIANQDLHASAQTQITHGRRLQRLSNLELTFSQLMRINLFSEDWKPDGPGSVPKLFISSGGAWSWHAAMDLVSVPPMRSVSHLFIEFAPAPADIFTMMAGGLFPDLEHFGMVVCAAKKTDEQTTSSHDGWIQTIRSQLESVIKGAPKLKRVYVHVLPAVGDEDNLRLVTAELRRRLAIIRGPMIAVGYDVESVNADLKERSTYWDEQGTFWEAASTRSVDVWAAGVPTLERKN